MSLPQPSLLWRPSHTTPTIPWHILLCLSSIWQGCNFTLVSYLCTARRTHSSVAPQRLAPAWLRYLCRTTPSAPTTAKTPTQNERHADARAVLRGDKSLHPSTGYPFPSLSPLVPHRVGLPLGHSPAAGTTGPGASPSPRALPTGALAIAYLGHFGNSLLSGRGGGRHGCKRRPPTNPEPQ